MSKKVSFSIEYYIQASPQLLFQYLSTPSGLSEWFADNVNSRGEIYTFIWDGSEEVAKLIQTKTNENDQKKFTLHVAGHIFEHLKYLIPLQKKMGYTPILFLLYQVANVSLEDGRLFDLN